MKISKYSAGPLPFLISPFKTCGRTLSPLAKLINFIVNFYQKIFMPSYIPDVVCMMPGKLPTSLCTNIRNNECLTLPDFLLIRGHIVALIKLIVLLKNHKTSEDTIMSPNGKSKSSSKAHFFAALIFLTFMHVTMRVSRVPVCA
jgi:hypothetical protein